MKLLKWILKIGWVRSHYELDGDFLIAVFKNIETKKLKRGFRKKMRT